MGKVPIVGIKNLSAGSYESFDLAPDRACRDGEAPAQPAQLGQGTHDRLAQQHEAGLGEIAKVGRGFETEIDGHGGGGLEFARGYGRVEKGKAGAPGMISAT